MVYTCLFIFQFFVAYYWAKKEIQDEGRIPWAGSLPCWRLNKVKIFGKYFSFGKEVTGYHVNTLALFVSIVVFSILSVVFFLRGILHEIDPEFALFFYGVFLENILQFFSLMIACFLQIVFVEDFLWNAIHPSKKFGTGVYRRKQFPTIYIFGIIPIDYILLNVGSLFFFYLADYHWYVGIYNIFGMICMMPLFIGIEKFINDKTMAEDRIEKYNRAHNFFEQGEVRYHLESSLRIIKGRKIIDHLRSGAVSIIPFKGRYSKEWVKNGTNPDSIESVIQRR